MNLVDETWRDLLWAAEQAVQSQNSMAVATLVHLEGSSYKGLGAQMVISANGETRGAISGGCIEADVALHAKEALETGKPKLVTYDARLDEDLIWGMGLGCEGLIQILIHPMSPEAALPLAKAITALQEQRKFALLAKIWLTNSQAEVEVLGHVLIEPEPRCADKNLTPEILAWVQSLAAHHWPDLISTILPPGFQPSAHFPAPKTGLEVVFQPVCPPPKLLICGGGFDTPPLMELANFLGWSPVLALPKRSQRFSASDAMQAAYVGSPKALGEHLELDRRTLAVIKSHHFESDTAYLQALLPTPVPYIGLLGPQKRANRMFETLEEANIVISDLDRERLHYPVGLDIGAETPREIAISIFAEMRAFIAGRSGGKLKFRDGAIHNRSLRSR